MVYSYHCATSDGKVQIVFVLSMAENGPNVVYMNALFWVDKGIMYTRPLLSRHVISTPHWRSQIMVKQVFGVLTYEEGRVGHQFLVKADLSPTQHMPT